MRDLPRGDCAKKQQTVKVNHGPQKKRLIVSPMHTHLLVHWWLLKTIYNTIYSVCKKEMAEFFSTLITGGQMNNKMIVNVYGCKKEI